jgi:hypothetical protein
LNRPDDHPAHRAVALGDLIERQREVEDAARLDLPVEHQAD